MSGIPICECPRPSVFMSAYGVDGCRLCGGIVRRITPEATVNAGEASTITTAPRKFTPPNYDEEYFEAMEKLDSM